MRKAPATTFSFNNPTSSSFRTLVDMPKVTKNIMLQKFDKLKAKARRKPKEKHASTNSDDDLKAALNLPPAVETAEPDGLWECLHLPPGSLATQVSVGAATTAGVELQVEEGDNVRVRKNNQDAFGVTPFFAGAKDAVLAAVYDGHGTHGGEVSKLVRDIVPGVMEAALEAHAERCGGLLREKLSEEERRRAYVRVMNKAFTEAEKELCEGGDGILHEFSGTTATCVWVDGPEVYVGWVGDSRAIWGGNGDVMELTWDHKPSRVDEKKRVRNCGGRVTRWKKGVGPQRVWLPDEWVPGLAMTRSIGDTVLSDYGVVAKPEVSVVRVGGGFIVAASDGVWEFMTSKEVGKFVEERRHLGAEVAARELVNEAVRRWELHETVVDDTTAVIVFLEENGRRSSRRELRREGRKKADLEFGVPSRVLPNGKVERLIATHGIEDEGQADD